MKNDTIAAIASGMSGSAGISIIRISGEDSFIIADRLFRSVSGKTVSQMESFKAAYGHIEYEGRILDEVLLIKMKAPHTYTREDVVEIDCHGGIVVTKAVLEAVLASGARPAEPGEFTKRAFLNGRIDLSQAEAVSDIISAKSRIALNNSVKQLRGDVREKIAALRERIISKTAFIEAALDDPEHYSLDGFPDELKKELASILGEINVLINSNDNGRIIKEGINTVFLGRPNAGKSSLLNVIIGHERAIVTEIAGTTRDTLEETVLLDGLVLNIIDTAGICDTDDVIEKIGVDKARKAAAEADLILYIIDSTAGLSDKDFEILDSIKEKKLILLINKTDIASPEPENLVSAVRKINAPALAVSAVTGEGIDDLKRYIVDMFFNGKLDYNDEIYITNLRHKDLLMKAADSLNSVIDGIDSGLSEDFYTGDLMAAYTSLGLITGDNVEDDLADRIFSEFCMGK